MNIDWSTAPRGTTGAMIANFQHSTGGKGHVEFIPSQGLRGDYNEGKDAWTYCDYNRVAPWNAEGLPPVGTVCEYDWHGVWSKGTVVALVDGGLGCEEVIIQLDGDWSFAKNTALFRPIRTAEQIAAEEREAGIRQLQIDHGVRARDGGRLIAEHLWDMGYRKQESSQ